MNQCVPSWDFDENFIPSKIKLDASSNSSLVDVPVPSLGFEVAELTWENGQPAMHGHGVPRVAKKPTASSSPTTWDRPRAAGGGGTLESIVDLATWHPQAKPTNDGGGDDINELSPWFDHQLAANPSTSPSITMTMDALVPCSNNTRGNDSQEPSTHVTGMGITQAVGCSTRVGSCSGPAPALDHDFGGHGLARVGINGCRTNGTAGESATCGGRESRRQVSLDTWDRELGGASLVSPENTVSGQEYTRTSADDRDSISHSKSQEIDGGDDREGKRKCIGKSSVSTKRSRAAAIHNQSERKRRDKINQRMKALQKLVPNSNKTDKASMLDEVIEYLKQLQAQVQMMNRMNMPSLMLPLAMQQQLQTSMMGMGMGMAVMGMNTVNQTATAAAPPIIPPTVAYMPATWDNLGNCLPAQAVATGSAMPDPLAALLAAQSQPVTMDAYNWLAAMFPQMQQPPASKN